MTFLAVSGLAVLVATYLGSRTSKQSIDPHLANMAPAVHSYLLPMPASPALPGPVQAALHELEADFALDADLLDKTVDQMMWEFSMGLSNYANDSNRDTFLPMM